MANEKGATRLTTEILQQLKNEGFAYLLIKGYGVRRKTDWIELDAFQMTPVKELPEGPGEKEIYAPVDSEILLEWASPENNVSAFIEMPVHQ